jgi:hypothetical protein
MMTDEKKIQMPSKLFLRTPLNATLRTRTDEAGSVS